VVLVITQHNLPEPCTDLGHAIMLPALKLSLDGFELRDIRFFAVIRHAVKVPLLWRRPQK
jgi:hypothetical protein